MECCKQKEDKAQEGAPAVETVSSSELWNDLKDREHWSTLIGTGGTWFLYDFCYYGTALFSPNIVNHIFGDSKDIPATCWQNIIANFMGIPGLLLAIWLLRPMGTKSLQMWGFVFIAAAYILLGPAGRGVRV
jgi:PHS family inorganic phosphate transporter-like MFS transporter